MRHSLKLTRLFQTPGKWLLAALIGLGFTASSHAAALEMYGSMQWRQWGYRNYYPYGAVQSGRYSNLGSAYYKPGDISVGYIRNRSYNGYSGSMSLEFWATPYYGATSGYVKMSRSIGRLYAQYYWYSIYRSGYMRHANQWRYPEFNLFEYTYYGWQWRDDYLFSAGGYL